jgi:hypothetical protein
MFFPVSEILRCRRHAPPRRIWRFYEGAQSVKNCFGAKPQKNEELRLRHGRRGGLRAAVVGVVAAGVAGERNWNRAGVAK